MSSLSDRLYHMSPERRRYVLRALTAHLEESGESGKLHRLLSECECREETVLDPKRGRSRLSRLMTRQLSYVRKRCENSWFLLQEQERESAAFLADVNRGWRLAERDASNEIQRASLVRAPNMRSEKVTSLSKSSIEPYWNWMKCAAGIRKAIESRRRSSARARRSPSLAKN